MLHVALHNPQIPPNTGNIIRLMANTGFTLHLIKPLGFNFEEKQLRRAGLDYHDLASVCQHSSYALFIESVKPKRVFAITTKGKTRYTDIRFMANDALLFGSETGGLPEHIMNSIAPSSRLKIPMQEGSRSLNLANAVAVVVYEVWRQLDFS